MWILVISNQVAQEVSGIGQDKAQLQKTRMLSGFARRGSVSPLSLLCDSVIG